MKRIFFLITAIAVIAFFSSCKENDDELITPKGKTEEWHTTVVAKTKVINGRIAVSDDRYWPAVDYYQHPQTGVKISFASVNDTVLVKQINQKMSAGERTACTMIFKTRENVEIVSDGYNNYENVSYELISAEIAEVLN